MPNDTDAGRTEKLQLLLDETELKVIDDWRFENRMPSRAAAIRELLRRGLNATNVEPLVDTDAPSAAFGVVPAAPPKK